MSGRRWLVWQVCILVALLVWGAIYTAAFVEIETRLEELERKESLQTVYIMNLREIMIKNGIDVPSIPQPTETETDER